MIIIYTPVITARLQYTCSFIFNELMGCAYELITDEAGFGNFDGFKINYSNSLQFRQALTIQPQGLLHQADISAQPIECFEYNGNKAFFKTQQGNYPFDIFAATFYLLSRYEEYLPHTKDIYGRYAHENSLAFKEGFLKQPLINSWVNNFVKTIEVFGATFHVRLPLFAGTAFTIVPTYDIDIAYTYKHKGFWRNAGGFIKQPAVERIQVLIGNKKDPFDCYEWLHQLHTIQQLQPIYFFLVSQKNGLFDKNILPLHSAMKQLIKSHAEKYDIGVHPSWQSGDDENLLQQELKELKNIAAKSITSSRQHFIRFSLPQGYQRLTDAGITDDYSMGYGSINGFRASVAVPFYWFNLHTGQLTTLRVHPFCYMETNSFYEQHFTAVQALEEMNYYYTLCKKVNGTFCCIWHNQFLGTDKMFAGWKEIYDQFIVSRG